MNTISKIAEKLRDPEYRKAFVASQINIGIPFQIRALLKARGWTQETLADRTDMRQPRISGLMTPGKVRPNIETLRRIAEAFDCGLMVRFVPFSELAMWSEKFDPDTFDVPDFQHDFGFWQNVTPSFPISPYVTWNTEQAPAEQFGTIYFGVSQADLAQVTVLLDSSATWSVQPAPKSLIVSPGASEASLPLLEAYA